MNNPEINTDTNNRLATGPPIVRPRPDQGLEFASRPETGEQTSPSVNTTSPQTIDAMQGITASMNMTDLGSKADELRDSTSGGAISRITKGIGKGAVKIFQGSTTDQIRVERRNIARRQQAGESATLERLLAKREAEKEK